MAFKSHTAPIVFLLPRSVPTTRQHKNSYLHIYCSGWGITLMGIWFYCSSIELPLAREGRSNRMEPTLIYFGEPRWMLKHERFSHHALPTTRPQTWNIIRGSSVRQGCFKQIVNSISPPPPRYDIKHDKSVLNCEIHTRQFFFYQLSFTSFKISDPSNVETGIISSFRLTHLIS